MATKIRLSWTIDATGTTFSPAQAATALGAVVLYQDPMTDPVLGQAFGLNVDTDTTAPTVNGATRTLTLNMTNANGAPPPFPCHPTTPTPPVLPYKLTRTVPLPGFFTVNGGSPAVGSSASQASSLNIGDTIQFASQLGVNYTVQTVSPLALTTPFTGTFANTQAFKVLPAGAKLPALYSTSPLDNASGSGARTVGVLYIDSAGTPGAVTSNLEGKRPSPIALAGGTIDIAVITGMFVASVGGFGASVGQITLCDLDEPIVFDDTDDEAQMKIDRALAYMPPSYFSLTQQGKSNPPLVGDFQVSPNSTNVVTTDDQTGALSPGNTMQFVSDPDRIYTVGTVTTRIVTLTTPYEGLEPDLTSATRITPSPAVQPTNEELKMLLGQSVTPGNAAPPPNPPLDPETMTPTPTILSDLFTQTISIALAIPVTPGAVALL